MTTMNTTTFRLPPVKQVVLVLLAWSVSFEGSAAIPALTIARATNDVGMSWPLETQGVVLEASDGFGASTRWWPLWIPAVATDASYELAERIYGNHRFYRLASDDYVRWIQTTDGPLLAGGLGVILPHEHIFTDLRGPTVAGYGQADPEDVVRVMKPLLDEAKAQGVEVLVECSSVGVGRNVPILARLARESGLRIMVPTGVYGRAQYAPQTYRDMNEDDLTQWMIREIREGIEETGIKAGFIKVASSESSLTRLEEKFLRSAGRAARETGVVVASHTISGTVAVKQLDILQQLSPSIRFIWVHAQAEAASSYHRQMAARGAFVEFDSVGASPDNQLISMIKGLMMAGYVSRVLLSHDAGWYQPGQSNGGTQRPYTYLLDSFVPKLRASGFSEETIRMLTIENPRRAFGVARRPGHPDIPASFQTR
jgi:phosphotriesterase-related protein